MSYSVHVGFGFHVNCYHSYRGDTCDAFGFGSDIRIIRYIIDTLDRCNAEGIPVKGTWDFENAYSLEEILPKYAPDIIEHVRERQRRHGDENILMGYNNGAMSAMTEDEFMASVQWAVTNEKKSGLADIFGSCERIIRPQEVMFTPSQAALYQKAGVQAVCLYYSCVPFDAFRTVVPPLSEEHAFNPLTYRYGDGHITILPTYSPADIMDAGSLRHWVNDLHEKQQKGDIRRDVFLFVNIDADSFLWEPFPVPKPLQKLPCFGGLEGLIREIADLPFIVFDTPAGYLRTHEPMADISFGEDVADGNFSGYSSWAEKPFNRQIWTRLERTRMSARLYGEGGSPSFEERVRLLSTTHFGLASPVLNITRERTALALSEQMMEKEEQALLQKWEQKPHKTKKHEVWLKNVTQTSFFGTQLGIAKGFCRDIRRLKVKGKRLQQYFMVPTALWEDGSVKGIYLLCRFETVKKKYRLHFKMKNGRCDETDGDERSASLTDAAGMCLKVNEETGFPQIFSASGAPLAEWDSRITYHEKSCHFGRPICSALAFSGQGKGMRLSGEIRLDGELEAGSYDFTFFTMKGESGIYVVSRVQYPYTKERETASSQAFNLGRCCDLDWGEVMPMELTLHMGEDAVVEKRNFMDDISSYPLSNFWHAFPQNHKLDSFNHHLTGGYLALHDETRGIVLSHARQVCGSMAHCPMRLLSDEEGVTVSLNPFGTYDGEQRYYPTRGNGCMMALYQATMPQARSLAPAYNGVSELSIQRISDYYGEHDDREKELADALAFADGCVVYATCGAVERWREDNVRLHQAQTLPAVKGKLRLIKALGKTKVSIPRLVMKYFKNIRFT